MIALREYEARDFHYCLVTMLLGTGMLVFNALGLSLTFEDVATGAGLSGTIPVFGIHGALTHSWYLEFWTFPQRVWMTFGCMLVVGGKLFDARFPRS